MCVICMFIHICIYAYIHIYLRMYTYRCVVVRFQNCVSNHFGPNKRLQGGMLPAIFWSLSLWKMPSILEGFCFHKSPRIAQRRWIFVRPPLSSVFFSSWCWVQRAKTKSEVIFSLTAKRRSFPVKTLIHLTAYMLLRPLLKQPVFLQRKYDSTF